jgi:hypothetical protein
MAGVAAPLVAGATLQYASRHHLQPSASPAEKPLVLVLWDDEASTFAASALVGSAALPASSFAFEIAEPTAEHPLERSLEEREPRLLLIDVDSASSSASASCEGCVASAPRSIGCWRGRSRRRGGCRC